jgi:TolA-binding protein
VGEYITIYQYQRSQQKARLEEKEKQLQNVSQDREELKSKLAQLQALVTQFVSERNTTPESHAQTASAKKEGTCPNN